MNRKLALANIAAAGALVSALCAPADAADLARRTYTKEYPPPPFVQPLYNWTGFYVGANFGGTFSSESITNGPAFSTDPSGVLGGFQAGYNYQFSPTTLVGVELEMDWTSATGTSNFGTGAVAGTLTSNHNWYDTLDGRLGYVMGTWLFYVKGGIAWMNADYMMTSTGAIVGGGTNNITRTGWNIGVGAEFMIMPQWSAKAEYNYLDFGSDSINFVVPVIGGASANTQVHEFKVGLNYHLPPGTLFGRW
jgi:opacity protein-like surface antigen